MFKKYFFLITLLTSFIISAQTVSTITQGSFSDALALDSQGNLYGSDWSGNTVYKYSTTGQVTIFKGGFLNPNGIGVNPSDEIFICDHTLNRIHKYDTNGNEITVYNGLFTTPAGIKNIPNTSDMLVVEYGTSFTATSTNSTIKKLAADGTVTTLHSGLPLNGPAGIAFINEIPYIANFNDRKIFKFENGILTEVAQLQSEGPPNANFLGFMSSLDNQLIATHIGGNKIYKIDPVTGIVSLYSGSNAGTNDGDITSATYSSPNGIIGDQTNQRIYISDSATKNLRIIDGAVLSTNDQQISKVEVNVYPNPNKDSLNIKITGIENNGNLKLIIYDVSGKEVLRKEIKMDGVNFEAKISTTGWGKGVFFLNIKNDRNTFSKKIIVE